MEFLGYFLVLILMLGMIGYTLEVGIENVVKELKRIAGALEGKNEKDKEAYQRFEQATEKSEILAKDPLLHIKHPGL